jgi:hypothetical protein
MRHVRRQQQQSSSLQRQRAHTPRCRMKVAHEVGQEDEVYQQLLDMNAQL